LLRSVANPTPRSPVHVTYFIGTCVGGGSGETVISPGGVGMPASGPERQGRPHAAWRWGPCGEGSPLGWIFTTCSGDGAPGAGLLAGTAAVLSASVPAGAAAPAWAGRAWSLWRLKSWR